MLQQTPRRSPLGQNPKSSKACCLNDHQISCKTNQTSQNPGGLLPGVSELDPEQVLRKDVRYGCCSQGASER